MYHKKYYCTWIGTLNTCTVPSDSYHHWDKCPHCHYLLARRRIKQGRKRCLLNKRLPENEHSERSDARKSYVSNHGSLFEEIPSLLQSNGNHIRLNLCQVHTHVHMHTRMHMHMDMRMHHAWAHTYAYAYAHAWAYAYDYPYAYEYA